jgi:hypothetical protein
LADRASTAMTSDTTPVFDDNDAGWQSNVRHRV